MFQVKCADGFVRQFHTIDEVVAYIRLPRVSAIVAITGPDGGDAYQTAFNLAK